MKPNEYRVSRDMSAASQSTSSGSPTTLSSYGTSCAISTVTLPPLTLSICCRQASEMTIKNHEITKEPLATACTNAALRQPDAQIPTMRATARQRSIIPSSNLVLDELWTSATTPLQRAERRPSLVLARLRRVHTAKTSAQVDGTGTAEIAIAESCRACCCRQW